MSSETPKYRRCGNTFLEVNDDGHVLLECNQCGEKVDTRCSIERIQFLFSNRFRWNLVDPVLSSKLIANYRCDHCTVPLPPCPPGHSSIPRSDRQYHGGQFGSGEW